MFWVFHQILLGLHILLAIVWVGGILFVGWGVYPAVKSMQPTQQRLFLLLLMQRTHWLFTLAGAGVITTGVLLGTTVGPIRHWQDLWSTTFGEIWLLALFVALFTLSWGVFAGYRQTMKVISNETLWQHAEEGDLKPLNKAMTATAALESVEVIGFIVLLVCMVLL